MTRERAFGLPILSSGSLATAGTYDFAVDFASIAGNIDAVEGCAATDFEFVDHFSDDRADSGCTAEFDQVLGTFGESNDFLGMRGPEAALQEADYFSHVAQFEQILRDGLGDAEFVARFRADAPSEAPLFSHYGIQMVDDSRGPFFEAVIVQVQTGEAGQTVIRAFRSRPDGRGISSQASIDLSVLSRIDLKLHFRDDLNRIFPSFSVDGGTLSSFLLNPDGSNFSVPAFPVAGRTKNPTPRSTLDARRRSTKV